MSTTPLIPISIIAGEVGATVDELAGRLGADVVLDSIGVRCCSVDRGRDVIADHRTRHEAEADRRRAAQAAAQANDQVLQRREALCRRPEARANVPAVVQLMDADAHEAKLEQAASTRREMTYGALKYHKIGDR